MRELVFGQAAEGLAQHFAIEAVLTIEMVVDGRLVDFGLGDDGADAGAGHSRIRRTGAPPLS